MTIKDLIGKVITEIYVAAEYEDYGLDRAECILQIDDNILVNFPWGPDGENLQTELPDGAERLLNDRTASTIFGFINKSVKFLFEKSILHNNVESSNNKLANIKNQRIKDFAWFEGSIEKGYLILENNYVITEITCAPSGTGMAGLNLFENMEEIISGEEGELLKLSECK